MNCGMCAEYCPFDAIKMDHDYEIASYDRMAHHIYDKEKLGKPASYYQRIRPVNYAREEAVRAEKGAAKAAAEKNRKRCIIRTLSCCSRSGHCQPGRYAFRTVA